MKDVKSLKRLSRTNNFMTNISIGNFILEVDNKRCKIVKNNILFFFSDYHLNLTLCVPR